jgi:hypothetical protein
VQVLLALHENLPQLIGLDVDLATTVAAATALADADRFMGGARAGGGGMGGPGRSYVPASLLAVVGSLRRDAAGVGMLGAAGAPHLAWPRAQVGWPCRQPGRAAAVRGCTVCLLSHRPASLPAAPTHPQADCNRAAAATRALLRAWRASAPAAASRALSTSYDCVCDLAPALKDLSRPAAVRGINQQLLSKAEGAILMHVVS